MGQLVSKIYGSALREAKMYNIEKRAEKVISKDKPTRAPMHPSAAKELESLREGKSVYNVLLLEMPQSIFLFYFTQWIQIGLVK